MLDLDKTIVTCSSVSELNSCTNEITRRLESDLARKFSRAVTKYLVADFDQAHVRLNGRSVADILENADKENPSDADQVVAEGEKDGVRFKLYEAPDKQQKIEKE